MSTTTTEVASTPQLITIDARKPESSGSSCHLPRPANRQITKRHRYRMIALALVHVYIGFHLISWHVFGLEIWGKTAMMGVPSLAKGMLNAAAIMVLLILVSISGEGFADGSVTCVEPLSLPTGSSRS